LTNKPIKRYQDVNRNVIDFIKDEMIDELSRTENINFSPEELDTINLHIRANFTGTHMEIRKLVSIIRRAKEKYIREQKEQKIIDERNRNIRNAHIASISPTVKPRSPSPTVKPRSPSPTVKPRSPSPAPVPVQGRVLEVIPRTKRRGQINIIDTPPDKQTYNNVPTEAEKNSYDTGLEWEHRVNNDYGNMWVYKNDVDKYKKLPDTSLTNSDELTIYDMDTKLTNLKNKRGGFKRLNETVVIDILGNKTALELKDYDMDYNEMKSRKHGVLFTKSKLIGNQSFTPYFIIINGKWKLYDIWYDGNYKSNENKLVNDSINAGWISPHKNLDYYAFIRMKNNGAYDAYSYNITEDLDNWKPIKSKKKGLNGEILYIIDWENIPSEFYFKDGIDEEEENFGIPTNRNKAIGSFYYIPIDKLHIIKYD